MDKEKILILGGTSFIGRNLVETLVKEDKYSLSLFNRGKTNRKIFLEINHIIGDRQTEDIKNISQTDWDYVIDVSCYYPKDLERVIQNLKIKPKKYIFISTCSVYDNESYKGILRSENAPILKCTPKQAIDTAPATYGQRKAACEKILSSSKLKYTILRPALVYGQYDPTDRFYYWLYQVKNYDKLLLPEKGERTFSITYVKDLVSSIIASLQIETISKVFNAISISQVCINTVVSEAAKQLNRTCTTENASATFLKDNKIAQWSGIPLWLNSDDFTYDNTKLKEELHIKTTPLDRGIKETISYFESIHWPTPKFGISQEKKKELLLKLDQ